MTTSDQELLDSLAKIIPLLTHVQKEKLLSFGEGMACANSGKDYYFPESEEKEGLQSLVGSGFGRVT